MKFSYIAFDAGGQSSSGTIDAGSPNEAREQLRRKNLFATDLRESDAGAPVKASSSSRKVGAGKRLKHLAMFARQLHVLVSSGTPVVQALSAIQRQTDDAAWNAVLMRIRDRVEEGTPLSEAMRQHSAHFDPVCRSLIAAGESSGNLPQMLDRLATLARKQLHLRNTIVGAMVYPSLLISLGVVVLITMLLFVLPRFAGLFESLDTPLPPTTKLLLWASAMLWAYWWALLAAVLGGFFGGRYWLGSAGGKQTLHTISLRAPKLGKLTRSLMTARLARMLGTLLESRVPLLDALSLTRDAAANHHYANLISRAEDAVDRGETITSVLCATDLISPCVQEALRNGEQAGQFGQPLVQMADFLDEENDIVVKSLTSIIEPIILIALGILVGGIAMSMFLPLFDLVSATHG